MIPEQAEGHSAQPARTALRARQRFLEWEEEQESFQEEGQRQPQFSDLWEAITHKEGNGITQPAQARHYQRPFRNSATSKQSCKPRRETQNCL